MMITALAATALTIEFERTIAIDGTGRASIRWEQSEMRLADPIRTRDDDERLDDTQVSDSGPGSVEPGNIRQPPFRAIVGGRNIPPRADALAAMRLSDLPAREAREVDRLYQELIRGPRAGS